MEKQCRVEPTTDALVFYYVDGGEFLKIYDKRDPINIHVFDLNDLERKILLSCIDVISFQRVKEQFPDIPEYKLAAILDTFEQKGIVFQEEGLYLSLPLRRSTVIHTISKLTTC